MLTTEKQKGVISTRCELHRNFALSLFLGFSKTNVLFLAGFFFFIVLQKVKSCRTSLSGLSLSCLSVLCFLIVLCVCFTVTVENR